MPGVMCSCDDGHGLQGGPTGGNEGTFSDNFPMRGGSSVFYFVRSHPCVPENVVLKAAVGRVLQLGCEQDPLRIDYIPVLEGAKHE